MTEDYQWKARILPNSKCTDGLVADMLAASTPTVDLSACAIGQPLKCRDGRSAVLLGSSLNPVWPFKCQVFSRCGGVLSVLTYTQDGIFQHKPGWPCDIVEVLPLEPAPTTEESSVDQPLWRVMRRAFLDDHSPSKRSDWAAAIEAVRDMIVPPEDLPECDEESLVEHMIYSAVQSRQAIRAKLTAEAERARRGE